MYRLYSFRVNRFARLKARIKPTPRMVATTVNNIRSTAETGIMYMKRAGMFGNPYGFKKYSSITENGMKTLIVFMKIMFPSM